MVEFSLKQIKPLHFHVFEVFPSLGGFLARHVWVFYGVDRGVGLDGLCVRGGGVRYGAAHLNCYKVVEWMRLCLVRSY